ncbi:hypothetical protein B0H17DRAFT_1096942 [Mycena rosella]|uniref:Uncharacterized protein n=1 Tax=Mycena rosella TaxID=1033263 RepID=A0AAD7CQU3_MYCRO|nr:hypothetical protein B0H17DRAFT_1096942 [Mycena rosella]
MKTARQIVETGNLLLIENTADVGVRDMFEGIYGVGQSTGIMWYAGTTSRGVVLTPAQKIRIL